MTKLIGQLPQQVPTNADLGTMAYQDKDNVNIGSFTSNGIDDNATSTVMTLDSNGNLLVGSTDTTPYDNTSGNAIRIGDGLITSAQEGGNAAIFNRMLSDGSIVQFRKDGTTVGTIGAALGQLFIGQSNTGVILQDGNQRFAPSNADGSSNDGNVTLGWSNRRFKDFYLSGEIKSTSGLLELDGNDIGGTQVTIADDAVASITPPRKGGFMFITAAGNSDYPQAVIASVLYYDVGLSLQLNRTTFGGVGGSMDVVTTDLTGTTGTDGRATVTVQTGVIKIENRYNQTITFQITFL
jgi:hypothetical protein